MTFEIETKKHQILTRVEQMHGLLQVIHLFGIVVAANGDEVLVAPKLEGSEDEIKDSLVETMATVAETKQSPLVAFVDEAWIAFSSKQDATPPRLRADRLEILLVAFDAPETKDRSIHYWPIIRSGGLVRLGARSDERGAGLGGRMMVWGHEDKGDLT